MNIGGLLAGANPVALLGTALPMVGDFLSYQGQKDTNAANAQQAAQQMAFQERMANTAHQREVSDLRAAGLNPILSGTGGAGSATPPGAQARMENPTAELGERMRATMLQHAQIKNLAADTDLKGQLRRQAHQAVNTGTADEQLRIQQHQTEQANTRAAEHTAAILANTAKGSKLEGEIDETRYGEVMRYIDRAIKAITGSSQSIRNVK